MPESPLVMACLLHEETDSERAASLRDQLQAEYPYMRFGLHAADSAAARRGAEEADLLLMLLGSDGRLPVFGPAWSHELLAAGAPSLIIIGHGTNPHAAPLPYDQITIPWDGSSIRLLKRHIGTQLRLRSGLVYIAFATEDGKVLAEQIRDALRERSYEVFYDPDDPLFAPYKLKTEYDSRMEKAIALLLVDTPGAFFRTEQVKTEMHLAHERQLLVKPLIWLPPAERTAGARSRFLEVDAQPAELADGEMGARLSEQGLRAFLDSFEGDLVYDMRRRLDLWKDARKMFADVGYSFCPKDPLRKLYESSRLVTPPAGVRVLSNATGRHPSEFEKLTAYAEYLNTDGFGASYDHRYYLHRETYLDEEVEQFARDCLAPAACQLLHFSDIQDQTELLT